MPPLRTIAIAVGAALFAVSIRAPSLLAQLDYRNLDDGRPVQTEDAYPVERYAFEALAPYRFESARGGVRDHVFLPELEFGAFDNVQLAVRAPVVGAGAGAGTRWGLAGLVLGALYNLNTESTNLPAFSARADLALPLGALAGGDTRVTLKAIATRSFGSIRLHLNLARGFGGDGSPGALQLAPQWSASFAADRTLFRQSLLLVAEIAAFDPDRSQPSEFSAALGARYQWKTTTVLDLGFGRRIGNAGPDLSFTFGISHAFAFRGLMPARAH